MVRLLLFILAALVLSGCDTEARREAERRAALLQQQLEQQYGSRKADIEELNRQADLAQACDYVIPICPSSMTEPGYEAIAAGFAGGTWVFWALVLVKVVVLASAMTAVLVTAWWGTVLLIEPAHEKVEEAKN